LKSLKIPVPPLQRQAKIADHITQIRSQAKQLQQEAKEGLEHVEAMLLGDS
jgi:restriction endonuclease S subunit